MLGLGMPTVSNFQLVPMYSWVNYFVMVPVMTENEERVENDLVNEEKENEIISDDSR